VRVQQRESCWLVLLGGRTGQRRAGGRLSPGRLRSLLRSRLSMVIRPRRLLFVVLTAALNAGVALAAPAFFPARVSGDGAVRRVAIQSDCRVHVELKKGAEALHPCGAPLSLSSEALLVWIEQGEEVSGQIAWPSNDVDLPLVSAGALQLELERPANDEQRTVRLLNAGSLAFVRTIRVGKAAQRLLMPQGTTIALELDARGDVSRLATAKIVRGRVATVRPIVPAEGAALVGIFTIRRSYRSERSVHSSSTATASSTSPSTAEARS
jgi:hypothetical protein